jgi:hypothetical protein
MPELFDDLETLELGDAKVETNGETGDIDVEVGPRPYDP